jgi:uncharacterized membrane protein
VNKPLILAGVIIYSLLVAGLRWFGVIGDLGSLLLFGVMVADLVVTHWFLKRRARKP